MIPEFPFSFESYGPDVLYTLQACMACLGCLSEIVNIRERRAECRVQIVAFLYLSFHRDTLFVEAILRRDPAFIKPATRAIPPNQL